jgi:hypothetical protein
MKDRIIILTGAGLTVGNDFFKISTLGITKDFINYNHPDLTEDKEFINFIYKEFCFWNNLDPDNIDKNLIKINFETIIHLIEELFAYVEDIERTNHNVKNQNNVKTTVFSVNKRLITHINRIRIPKWKDGMYLFIEKTFNHLIDIIIDNLKLYEDDEKNKGMNRFVDFLYNNFTTEVRRIYTLNYDTWLNKYAFLFDGFINNDFESSKVIFDRDIDCHYNSTLTDLKNI